MVCVNLARWLEGVEKYIVDSSRLVVGIIGSGFQKFIVGVSRCLRGIARSVRRRLGGSRVFVLLAKVAFDRGVGFGKVFSD